MTMKEAERAWEVKMFYQAHLRRFVRGIVITIIFDTLFKNDKTWEAFTACQSITPR